MSNNLSEHFSPITKTVFLASGWTFGTIFQYGMDSFSLISDEQVNTAISSIVFIITGLYGIINIYNAVRKEITKRKSQKHESK